MRPTNSADQRYQPGQVPDDPAQLQRFFVEELARLKTAIDSVADGFAPVVYSAPAKPRDGMFRNADGVQWNPGSGAGLYRYGAGVWNFIG